MSARSFETKACGHKRKMLENNCNKNYVQLGELRKTRIENILVQFKGLKFITGIKKNDKRQIIGSMRDKEGDLQSVVKRLQMFSQISMKNYIRSHAQFNDTVTQRDYWKITTRIIYLLRS